MRARVREIDDGELYRRGLRTLAASWQEYARGAVGAVVQRLPGAVAAVFPWGPESAVYDNALLERGLDPPRSADMIGAVEAVYASAGAARFAVWVESVMRLCAASWSGAATWPPPQRGSWEWC